MKKNNLILASTILIFSLSSCSLNYTKDEKKEYAKVPNFSFKNATYTQYENNNISMQLQSELLEQYTENSTFFALNPEFYVWNNDNTVGAQGKCKYLSINNSTSDYTMYNNIYIQDFQNDVFIQGDTLRYNAKTDQLSSGKGDLIYLEKGDTILQGKGFSASGLTKTYKFESNVKGELKNTSENENSDSSAETEQAEITENSGN